MFEEGILEIRKSIDLAGENNTLLQIDLGHAYASAGKIDEVRKILTDFTHCRRAK